MAAIDEKIRGEITRLLVPGACTYGPASDYTDLLDRDGRAVTFVSRDTHGQPVTVVIAVVTSPI